MIVEPPDDIWSVAGWDAQIALLEGYREEVEARTFDVMLGMLHDGRQHAVEGREPPNVHEGGTLKERFAAHRARK